MFVNSFNLFGYLKRWCTFFARYGNRIKNFHLSFSWNNHFRIMKHFFCLKEVNTVSTKLDGELTLKGNRRCKKITQNVPSMAEVKNHFVSLKSHVLLSRYSKFCIFNHPMIYQIFDVMKSIRTWDRVSFWIYIMNHKLLIPQAWSTDGYNQGQYFFEIFWMICKTGATFQAYSNLGTCSNWNRPGT